MASPDDEELADRVEAIFDPKLYAGDRVYLGKPSRRQRSGVVHAIDDGWDMVVVLLDPMPGAVPTETTVISRSHLRKAPPHEPT